MGTSKKLLLLFSCEVASYSLRSPVLQHTRLPCVSLSSGVCSTYVQWVIDAIQPSHPLLFCSSCSQALPASVFSNELALHIRWPKYWSFSISPSNEYSVLISFRIDWFDLLAVQGTLKSLFQHHSLKASIPQHSSFFTSNSHIHTRLLEKP